jgi:hypothetical protein
MSELPEHEPASEQLVLTRLLHLNALVYGLVTGVSAGLMLFVATNWLVLKGGDVVGPHLSLLSQFFVGYRVTFGGSFIGLLYGCLLGFVGGYSVARTYNWFASLRGGLKTEREDRVEGANIRWEGKNGSYP